MTPPTPITDTAVTLTDSLFSLMDTATGTTVTPPIPEIQVVTEKIPEAIMPLPSLLETTSETILPVIETTPLSLIANTEPSIIEETDEEQPMNEIGK